MKAHDTTVWWGSADLPGDGVREWKRVVGVGWPFEFEFGF